MGGPPVLIHFINRIFMDWTPPGVPCQGHEWSPATSWAYGKLGEMRRKATKNGEIKWTLW